MKITPTTEQALVIEKVRAGKFKVTKYYTYPTGTRTPHLHEQHINGQEDPELHAAVESAFSSALSKVGFHSDNKTAVEIIVDGETTPFYLSRYDSEERIVSGVDVRTGRVIEIPQDNL